MRTRWFRLFFLSKVVLFLWKTTKTTLDRYRTFQILYLSGHPILKINKQNQAIYIYNTTTNQNTSKESIATANELAGIESLTDHN